MAEKIGNLREIQSEVRFEWELKDFFPLCEEKKKRFRSSKCYFSGASWECTIYPNGDSDSAEGWISLYLIRTSSGFPVNVEYTLIITSVAGTIYAEKNTKNLFENKNEGWGYEKFMLRSDLLKQKSQLNATNDVLIICNLKNRERKNVAGSLFARQQEVCDNMLDIFTGHKGTDYIINVDGHRIRVHRMILETRSPVLAAMFKRDSENQTSQLTILNIDVYTMVSILKYMYSGDIELNTKNALKIYSAAERYDMKDLKQICLDFITRNLSEDCVCEVLELSELYQDEKMFNGTVDYIEENAKKILESEKWIKMVNENPALTNKVLKNVVKAFSAKKMRIVK